MNRMRAVLLILVVHLLALSLARADENSATATPLSAEQVFENLKANKRVRWLVRMVAYDPSDPKLRVDHLSMLGGPSEDFTFVADYEEVCGYTVSEATHKAGGAIHDGQGVSAIVFPIENHTIFPASVRGMLQVVQQIDMRRAIDPGYHPAPLDVLLTDSERANLAVVDLDSWAWDNYRDHFLGFAQAFETLRRKNASAIRHIGHIGADWCEPGCSRLLHPHQPSDENLMTLALPGGKKFEIKNLGVRVFLIRNLSLDQLPRKRLFDFADPKRQTIPQLDFDAEEEASPAPQSAK